MDKTVSFCCYCQLYCNLFQLFCRCKSKVNDITATLQHYGDFFSNYFNYFAIILYLEIIRNYYFGGIIRKLFDVKWFMNCLFENGAFCASFVAILQICWRFLVEKKNIFDFFKLSFCINFFLNCFFLFANKENHFWLIIWIRESNPKQTIIVIGIKSNFNIIVP